MDGQLEELIIRASWPNVTLQILPFSSGFTRANGTFAIFEPRDPGDMAVVNVESTGQDAYFETPSEVAKYEAIWADVLHWSLDPDQSRSFIEQMLTARRSS